MPVGDILESKSFCVAANQIGLNVRHWRVTAVGSPEPSVTSIATGLRNLWFGAYADLITTAAAFAGVSVQKIRPLPAGAPSGVMGPSVPGLVAGDELPRQVAGIITLRTALAGRRNRGRVYIPFPGEADNSPTSLPIGGYTTRLSALGTLYTTVTTLTVGAGSITLQPVIYHRRDFTTVDLTGFVSRSVWATQRRRGSYGRPNVLPT